MAAAKACLSFVAASLLCTLFVGWPDRAFAYRPFDGTGADVTKAGEVEVELQPAGHLQEGARKTLLAPASVFNFGLGENWEAVLQGQWQTPLSPSGPGFFSDGGLFLKRVVIPGSLQDKAGPSVATEFGLLLPDSTGKSSAGASLAGIVSQRWDWGAIHLNAAAELTRDQHANLFAGSIFEGPSNWTVRPVAEVFYEREFGQSETISGLVGLIWQVRDDLAFDVAFRHALTNGQPVNEVRAGVTFGFSLLPVGMSRPTAADVNPLPSR
jgi:hypothetical protein